MWEKNNMNTEQENIITRGKIFELVQTKQPDGRIFEVARRAPGVRVIIHDGDRGMVLLTREFRPELDTWDHRLPGGKVFDTLGEYSAFRESNQDIIVPASEKARQESLEEAGIIVDNLMHVATSNLGATVEWDLFVFEADDWQESPDGSRLEAGEDIESSTWYSYAEAEEMILDGELQEERIALILLRWLRNK